MTSIDWKGALDRLVYALVPSLVALTAKSGGDDWPEVWDAITEPAFIFPLVAVSLGISALSSQMGDKTAGFGKSKQDASNVKPIK